MPTIRRLNADLKRRREATEDTEAVVRQADVALRIGKSQSLISKIERGLANLATWQPDDLYDLLLAYGVKPTEMPTLTEEPQYHEFRAWLADRNQTYRVREGEGQVRFLGKISAGRLGESYRDDERETVSAPDAITARYRLDDVFAVNVNGQSMIDQDARRTIPPGSLVFFHSKLRPEPGEIVCVYLAAHDQTVLKVWRPKDGYAVLESNNAKHAPIIVTDEDDATLQGVYLTHIPETGRLR